MANNMWTVLLFLLVAWVVLSIVGFAFEGRLWLAIIGIVLFVGILLFELLRQRAKRSNSQLSFAALLTLAFLLCGRSERASNCLP